MKTLIALIISTVALIVQAQTNITIAVIVNESGSRSTNAIALSALQVSGLRAALIEANFAQTNRVPPLPVLSFQQFLSLELASRLAIWTRLGSREEFAVGGFKREELPEQIAVKWPSLTAQQRRDVTNYLNLLKP